MINRYLKATFKKDGMEYPYLNCWGLTRLVRHELYGLSLLSSFDIDAMNKRKLTIAANDVIKNNLIEGLISKGSIAAAWIRKLCVHVAVVVEINNRLVILDINDKQGVKWVNVSDFEAKYLKVTYYNDKNIS